MFQQNIKPTIVMNPEGANIIANKFNQYYFNFKSYMNLDYPYKLEVLLKTVLSKENIRKIRFYQDYIMQKYPSNIETNFDKDNLIFNVEILIVELWTLHELMINSLFIKNKEIKNKKDFYFNFELLSINKTPYEKYSYENKRSNFFFNCEVINSKNTMPIKTNIIPPNKIVISEKDDKDEDVEMKIENTNENNTKEKNDKDKEQKELENINNDITTTRPLVNNNLIKKETENNNKTNNNNNDIALNNNNNLVNNTKTNTLNNKAKQNNNNNSINNNHYEKKLKKISNSKLYFNFDLLVEKSFEVNDPKAFKELSFENYYFSLCKLQTPKKIKKDNNKYLKLLLILSGINFKYHSVIRKEVVDEFFVNLAKTPGEDKSETENFKMLYKDNEYLNVCFYYDFCVKYDFCLITNYYDPNTKKIENVVLNDNNNDKLFILLDKIDPINLCYDAYVINDKKVEVPINLQKKFVNLIIEKTGDIF